MIYVIENTIPAYPGEPSLWHHSQELLFKKEEGDDKIRLWQHNPLLTTWNHKYEICTQVEEECSLLNIQLF